MKLGPKLEALLQRAFPGMGLRPLWITLLGLILLVLYYHHGMPRDAPSAFIEAATGWTGVQVPGFHKHGWAHLSAAVLLLGVPLLASRVFEGWRARDLGMVLKGTRREFLLVLVLWVAFVPVLWGVSHLEAFQRTYPRLQPAETDMVLFLAYQAFYLLKWTAWEFFFRGFLLFGYEKDFGSHAVLLSTLPFVLMHVGKPEPEMLGSIAAGLLLGWLALKSRSIWPGVFIHSMVATTMDFFASSWWQ